MKFAQFLSKSAIRQNLLKHKKISINLFSTSSSLKKDHYKLLIIGGGSGGAATSSVFGSKLGKNNVAVIEPNDTHYYQPMWTLVGAGIKKLEQSAKPMEGLLNKSTWIKESAAELKPDNNLVITDKGKEIEYDYLVVAMGLQLRYDLIKGLPEAFSTPGVCSNYHKDYVKKTLQSLKNFQSGNAIFTFPNTPIKCAGAPQKIMYLAEDFLRQNSKRDKANIIYNTSLGVIFGVKKYAAVLQEICRKRNIAYNVRHTLVEVKADKKEAIFDVTNADNKFEKKETFPYELLHVGAPCSSHEVLRKSPLLTDQSGFLNLNKSTLQHVKYSNVFGIGDCTNLPTAKTAAAVGAEMRVLSKNLTAAMNNKKLEETYDGYTSCPLVTSFNTCVLAEFDYNMQPLETFPFDQGKERRSMFYLKKDFMPFLYWNGALKGLWQGPKRFRQFLHLKR